VLALTPQDLVGQKHAPILVQHSTASHTITAILATKLIIVILSVQT
jgi:hypothetical protein